MDRQYRKNQDECPLPLADLDSAPSGEDLMPDEEMAAHLERLWQWHLDSAKSRYMFDSLVLS